LIRIVIATTHQKYYKPFSLAEATWFEYSMVVATATARLKGFFMGFIMSLSHRCTGVWFPIEVWNSSSLSFIEKGLIVEIHSLDNEDNCFAGNEYFAKFFNCSAATIKRCLAKLRKDGWIEDVKNDGRKRYLKSLLYNKLPDLEKTTCASRELKMSSLSAQIEPHINISNNTPNNSCSSDDERHSDLGKKEGRPTKENVKEQGFEEFWKLYPRKQGKVNALKSWKTKGCSAKTQAILASLSFRLSAAPPNGWAGIETNFVPLPATFLNQQRWEDTPVPAKVGDMTEDEKARRIEIFKAKEAWKGKRDRLSLIENIKHGRARDLRTPEEKAADVILEAEGLEEWDKSWD